MGVVGPKVTCHVCGAKMAICGDGKMPWHDAKGTRVPCVGSRERPK